MTRYAVRTEAIEVVMVAYRGVGTVAASLKSLLDVADSILVVDNSATESSAVRAVVAGFPHVRYIPSPSNVGFAAAANLGAARATSKYLAFVNPDCTTSARSLRVLARHLHRDQAIRAIGPVLVCRNGQSVIAGGAVPTLRVALAYATGLCSLFPRMSPWRLLPPRTDKPIQSIGWVAGTCLVVRRSEFEALGGFDERYFLYCEDVDLCHRLVARFGGHNAVALNVVVEHNHQSSTPSNPRGLLRLHAIALRQFLEQRYSRALASMIRLALALGEARVGSFGRLGTTRQRGRLLTVAHARFLLTAPSRAHKTS